LGEVSEIAAGVAHTCVVNELGGVRCWGDNSFGQISVPNDLGRVIKISSGFGYHTCALNFEGEVNCWGYNGWGQTNVPSGLRKITQITSGYVHNCAVDERGILTCWGANYYGQGSVPENSGKILSLEPKPLELAPKPSVSGSFIIGSNVSAVPDEWDSGTTLTYHWLRDGVVIPNANSSSYTLQKSDYLKRISVSVTGSKEGYLSETKTSDAVIPVKPKEKIASLSFTGTLKVGEKAYVGPSNRNGKFDYSYQWLRDGVEIAGATSRTYLIGSEDLGSNLSAKVCALYLKDVSHCVSQDAGSTVQLGVLKNVKTSISGVAKVGRMLNSTPVIFDKQATVSYQWLRNGDPILDATRNTYFAGVSDKGSSISLRVTVSKPGYETVVKTSSAKLISGT